MSAEEAVDLGFADRVLDPVKIAASADFSSVPLQARATAEAG